MKILATHTRVKRALGDELGGVVALITVIIFVICAVAAIALDGSLAYLEQRKIHYAADAGALAGARFIAQDPQPTQAQIIAEATTFTLANGAVQPAELALMGGVQLGNWTSGSGFVAGAGPINAIRVPVRRNVPAVFSRILGYTQLSPPVDSIAVVGGTGSSSCNPPFALQDEVLQGMDYGDIISVDNYGPSGTTPPDDGSGNWGKLDLCGLNMSGSQFPPAMVNGVCCGPISIGDVIYPANGAGHIGQGFDARMSSDPIMTIAVIDQFLQGNHPVVVVGFVVVEILSHHGNGEGWSAQLRILDRLTGSGVGGPAPGPWATTRILVQ